MPSPRVLGEPSSSARSVISAIQEYQRTLGKSLLDLLPGDLEIRRVLQVGASSGDLSRLVRNRHPGAALWVIDQSAKRLIAHAEGAPGEAPEPTTSYSLVDTGSSVRRTQRQVEKAKFPRGGFDLVVSHSEMPRLDDLAVHFYFVRLLLARGGFYVVTGPGPNHLPELYSILGLPPHLLGRAGAYPVDHVAHLAEAAGLEIIRRVTTGGTFDVESPSAVVDHATAIGLLPRPLRGARRSEVLAAYAAGFGRAEPEGSVRATFDQWLLCLRSPGPPPRRSAAASRTNEDTVAPEPSKTG